mmetsp:Transcript_21708/g.37492  ORF Transcript_21708/g.37492 Transcript_21708/m.37492 type:complete len:126 (-) Transcript_21708:202-579(-)
MSNFLCFRRMGWKHPKPPVVVEHPPNHAVRRKSKEEEFIKIDVNDPVPHAVESHAHHEGRPPETIPSGVHVHHPPQPPTKRLYLAHHHYNKHNREVDEENIYYTKHPIPEVDHTQHPRKIYHNYE